MVLGLTQPHNRFQYQEYFLGGKGDRCIWLATLLPSCADCHEIWEPQPPGNFAACPGLYRDSFTLVVISISHVNSLRSGNYTVVHVSTGALHLLAFLIVCVTGMAATFRCAMFGLPVCMTKMRRLNPPKLILLTVYFFLVQLNAYNMLTTYI
jgi:hypothetical protein